MRKFYYFPISHTAKLLPKSVECLRELLMNTLNDLHPPSSVNNVRESSLKIKACVSQDVSVDGGSIMNDEGTVLTRPEEC